MKAAWLAIDTAGDVASVVVASGRAGSGQIGASDVIRGARQQARGILVVIDATLKQAGTTLDDLAGIVLGDGPGSFTGLRVGWAAAKGLAHEREIPLFAVPSLMGLAWVAWSEFGLGPMATIAACYDALRGQVYGALYRFARDRCETLVPPAVLTIADFRHRAPIPPDAAIGDGARRFAEEIRVWTGRPPLDERGAAGTHATVAHGLLALMRSEGAAYRLPVPAGAEPVYGRPAEAQAQWEARHGRPLRDSSRPAS